MSAWRQSFTYYSSLLTSPQPHSSLSVKPHFLWHALQWPWPVRNWVFVTSLLTSCYSCWWTFLDYTDCQSEWTTWPAATCPGHQIIVGSLLPPSNVVSFPHRNGPFDPPSNNTVLQYSRFHTLRFIDHFPVGPGFAGTGMSPVWILLELRTMDVAVTTGAIRCATLQPNHHYQQTNIQFFYRPDALPVTQPTVSEHWRD